MENAEKRVKEFILFIAGNFFIIIGLQYENFLSLGFGIVLFVIGFISAIWLLRKRRKTENYTQRGSLPQQRRKQPPKSK